MSVPAVDKRTHDWFVAHRVGWLTPAEKAITQLGSTSTVVVVAMLLSVVLLWRTRTPRHALYLAMTTTTACVALFVVRGLAKRERPPRGAWLVDGPGYSFPSGHATLSAALAMALVILAIRRLAGQWVWPAAAAGLLFSLFVGCSRLYLGVHWLTDVLAGWALGVLVALGTGWALRKFTHTHTHTEEAPCPR